MKFHFHDVTRVVALEPKMDGKGRWQRTIVIFGEDERGAEDNLEMVLHSATREGVNITEDTGEPE